MKKSKYYQETLKTGGTGQNNKKPFKVIHVERSYGVVATKKCLLKNEDEGTCVALFDEKEKANHLCGKLNDAVVDAEKVCLT